MKSTPKIHTGNSENDSGLSFNELNLLNIVDV